MTKRFLLAATILGLTALPLGLVAEAQTQSAPPQGDVGHGKALLTADGCYQCHGYVGQGARTTGPRIARTRLPYDAFIHQLRQPADEMPPYTTAVLSNQDAADIFAYLQSLPVPPSPKDIAILNN